MPGISYMPLWVSLRVSQELGFGLGSAHPGASLTEHTSLAPRGPAIPPTSTYWASCCQTPYWLVVLRIKEEPGNCNTLGRPKYRRL